MSRSTALVPVDEQQGTRRWAPGDGFRLSLALLFVAAVVGTLGWGARTASLDDLGLAVSQGGVTSVTVSGGLPPGAQGYSLQEVRWRQGGLLRTTEVTQVSRGSDGPADGPVLHQDVATWLRAQAPGELHVDRVGFDGGPWSSAWGFRAPAWVGLAFLAAWVGCVGRVIAGPAPWRATRWAWFWLLLTPVGVPAFLLLGGPTPGLPSPRRRLLTGGWAFLLFLLLSGAASR